MVRTGASGSVLVVTIDRPERRNAVDAETARALESAFADFDANAELRVAVLTGSGGNFCAGADLKSIAAGGGLDVDDPARGPMGPTRMAPSKPVIAAVEGYCVAGGLELALWCDLRVAARDAVFGVFNRRFGVPLVDGGTVRLARLVGQGLAMDMLLTGRPVHAEEGERFGLVNRVVRRGAALVEAVALAEHLAAFPQTAMRNDRRSLLEQWGMGEREALANEHRLGQETLAAGEGLEGAHRFAAGEGRGGRGT
jgi:enoyl-CoA hydratase/carnithine racemase